MSSSSSSTTADVLIPVDESVRAGITWAVFMDADAYADVVAWGPDQQQANPEACQQESGRLWDVLWLLACHLRGLGRIAIVSHLFPVGSFVLYRVPGDRADTTARHVTLDVFVRMCGGEPQFLVRLGEGIEDGQSPYGDDED